MRLDKLRQDLKGLSQTTKTTIIVFADIALAIIAMWLAYTLRLESWHVPTFNQGLVYVIAIVGFLTVFRVFHLYNFVISYSSLAMINALARGVFIYGLILLAILMIAKLDTVPRSVAIIQPLIFLILLCSMRIIAGSFLFELGKGNSSRRILIYGAGAVGAEIISSLQAIKKDEVVGFLDDDKEKYKRKLSGKTIYNMQDLQHLIDNFGVTDVFLSMPTAELSRRKEIIESLMDYKVRVSTVPSYSELLSDTSRLRYLKPLSVDDILPREVVSDFAPLRGLAGKTVLITGAGGSIGSEICHQLIENDLEKIIIVDHSEFNLYMIDRQLRSIIDASNQSVAIETILADVRDEKRIKLIFDHNNISIIYHAAAYKHVPLIEKNPVEALTTNFLGTKLLSDLAILNKVEKFILISTDKAVRPTNIMGATKRLAELTVQNCANKQSDTVFSMVRFGNVIGSSGSAIPLFQEQILKGGPITVTHPDVTRYFMTIREAVSLVLQAGAMAEGGEVFVLDMGDSIKVVDIVRRMVTLSGMKIKDEYNPQGDIAIEFIGLRAGEKLYEELLLGEDIRPTKNKRIFKAMESHLSETQLDELRQKLLRQSPDQKDGIRTLLLEKGLLINGES